jgi:hypothetical protein
MLAYPLQPQQLQKYRCLLQCGWAAAKASVWLVWLSWMLQQGGRAASEGPGLPSFVQKLLLLLLLLLHVCHGVCRQHAYRHAFHCC